MKLAAMFNDDIAYDLGLTLDDTYVLGYLYKVSTTTNDTKIINNNECFTFNLTDLFKSRKRVFDQIPKEIDLEDVSSKEIIKKIYDNNRKKFDRMLKKNLSKLVIKVKNIKDHDGSKTYYRLNRNALRVLIDGYPVKIDTEFTDKEKIVMEELNINNLSKGISTQLKEMDIEVLKDAIQVSIENNILEFPYVKSVYNNLIKNKKATSAANTNDFRNIKHNSNINNNIPCNVPSCNHKNNNPSDYKKTKFHNFTEHFYEYSDDYFQRVSLEKWAERDNQ